MPSFISIDRHVPHPRKPGALKYIGRLTTKQLVEKIGAAMSLVGLDSRFEWRGMSPCLKYGYGPLKLHDELPIAHVTATWHPGNNEGYIVELFTHHEGEKVCLWHAKMFDVAWAIAAHLVLIHLFFWEGTMTEQFLKIEIERLLAQRPNYRLGW